MTPDEEAERWAERWADGVPATGTLHYIPQEQRDAINTAWENEETLP